MVIQRWQSVLLLISAIFVALVGILPYAVTANGVDVCAVQTPVLLCVDILVALLLLIDIFLYRNLRYQMKVTRLALGLIVVLEAAIAAYTCAGLEGATISIIGGIVMPMLALISSFVALRLMHRDYRLLRSADRLR
ncbi:uncharacterized protein BN799_01951 [Prevotella sp. CAG:873]|nr:uncharacterized protein BN799_01951 [Prevotella sp. CAG:873]